MCVLIGAKLTSMAAAAYLILACVASVIAVLVLPDHGRESLEPDDFLREPSPKV